MSQIAPTPQPPYYAVIFTSERTDGDNGYADMALRMLELAAGQPGYLGIESARSGLGITVSYWDSRDAIAAWKRNTEVDAMENADARAFQTAVDHIRAKTDALLSAEILISAKADNRPSKDPDF